MHRIVSIAASLIAGLYAAGSVYADGPAVAALAGAPVRLSISQTDGVQQTEPGVAKVNAGIVDSLRTDEIKHTFVVKNETAKPVEISGLRASCGCETLLLTKGGAQVKRTTLQVGEQAEVTVRVRLHGSGVGTLQKFAWVDGPGAPTALATLEVDFTLRRAVQFEPDLINLGTVPVGGTGAAAFTVTVDSEALPPGGFPELSSTNPAVKVTPSGDVADTSRDGKPAKTRSYRAVLTQAVQPGDINGYIGFIAPATEPAKMGQRAPIYLANARILGEIAGDLALSPAILAFGSTPHGQPLTRQIIVSARAAQTFDKMRIAASQPYLTAALMPSGSPNERILQVTLGAAAPAGPVSGKVTLTSAAGQSTVLQVIGDVIGKTPVLAQPGQ